MEELSKNPYVLSVSPKGITYTDAFKEIFMVAYKQGKLPREIFKAHGFRVEVLGMKKFMPPKTDGVSPTRRTGS